MLSAIENPAATDVLAHLEEILSSPYFRTSQRCSRMLRYVVEHAAQDPSAALKERTIGVDVFHRDPHYDTSLDPVVRATAGEIRKRLAQFYGEHEHSPMTISLSPGCYLPHIHVADRALERNAAPAPDRAAPPSRVQSALLQLKRTWLYCAGAMVLIAGAAVWWFVSRPAPLDQFWAPFYKAGSPTVAFLGDTSTTFAGPRDPGMRTVMKNGRDDVVMSSAIANNDRLALADVIVFSQISTFLSPRTGRVQARDSLASNYSDLQQQPSVLIGGRTNQWSMRAMAHLRYQLAQGSSHDIVLLRDIHDPAHPLAQTDFSVPYEKVDMVYALIARYIDPSTNRPTVIIAGLGAMGTQAAGDFLASPDQMKEFASHAPKGWDKKNVEIVLEAPMVGGYTGPPHILRVYTW